MEEKKSESENGKEMKWKGGNGVPRVFPGDRWKYSCFFSISERNNIKPQTTISRISEVAVNPNICMI